MAKHRLTTDFMNKRGVRFLTCYGEVRSTSQWNNVATIDRRIAVGDTWEEGEE
ncbi:hypothetical protein SEA_LUCHADOR_94 [Mycobacterium phage Luchador]|uniref:Uncharacterized protein n=1 Tax=Mycobacterium phage Luchador TaxID=1647300 RepID=A0A0F6YQ06_9CAUD|nr:hypothetical protein AVT52_gp10 [Mycobacterium phage Luchador]AKF14258.1 hypothetical protein SEA_LUCHADOR_94 [Mycobacterium phage Luchador]